MRKKILELLGGHFDVDEEALKNYLIAASVRYGSQEMKLRQQMCDILLNQNNLLEQVVFNKEYSQWKSELKLLEAQNREHFVKNNDIPEAYKEYLTRLSKEIRNPAINSPTLILKEKEKIMHDDFVHRKFIGDDYSHLEGLDTAVIRLILQEWLLHPGLVCNPEETDLMLYILEYTELKL